MITPSVLSRKRTSAFTLIELLTTLTIMAVMAAMLFPFIQNYQYRAKTASTFSSLKIMQDAMGRYSQMNNLTDDFDPNRWGGSATLAGPWVYFTNASVTNEVTFCARTGDGSDGDRIIDDITSVSSNQVLKLTPELHDPDYVLFYRTGPITNMTFFPVFYNIDEPGKDATNGDFSAKNDYVNRHGARVSNAKQPGFPTDSGYIIGLFQ